MGEVWDEFVIEICKTQEGMNAFNRGRGFTVPNGSKLDQVHGDLSLTNDHAQEFHLGGVKKTFGEF